MSLPHYAVVVGIDCYPSPDLRSLSGARGDAMAFYNWLIHKKGGGLAPENVRRVIIENDCKKPSRNPQPTRGKVVKALAEIRDKARAEITADLWPQSRLYYYVSGHGVATEDPSDAILLMADTVDSADFGNSLSSASVLKWFTLSQHFRELAFFADCCRHQVHATDVGSIAWSPMNTGRGDVTSIFGCATYFGETAYEPFGDHKSRPDQFRGYYTQALLEGLEGRAVDPDTGSIHSHSLDEYCKRRVRSLTGEFKIPQRPTMSVNTTAKMVFRSNIPPSEIKAQSEARSREIFRALEDSERSDRRTLATG